MRVYRLSIQTPIKARRASSPIPTTGFSTAPCQNPAKTSGIRRTVTASVANVRRSVILFPQLPSERADSAGSVIQCKNDVSRNDVYPDARVAPKVPCREPSVAASAGC